MIAVKKGVYKFSFLFAFRSPSRGFCSGRPSRQFSRKGNSKEDSVNALCAINSLMGDWNQVEFEIEALSL